MRVMIIGGGGGGGGGAELVMCTWYRGLQVACQVAKYKFKVMIAK